MSALPRLDTRSVRWDPYRGAVVAPAGQTQVVISLEALESWAGRSLNEDEAIETVIDERAMFAAIANTLAETDGVITITSRVVNSRSWTTHPYSEAPEDAGSFLARSGGSQ